MFACVFSSTLPTPRLIGERTTVIMLVYISIYPAIFPVVTEEVHLIQKQQVSSFKLRLVLKQNLLCVKRALFCRF